MRNFPTRWTGAASIILGIASLLLLALSAYGYRNGWWSVLTALDLTKWGAWAAIAGALASLLAQARWLRQRSGGLLVALLGLALSLPVLSVAAGWEYATRTTPPINDISTDTEDPPVFWATPTPTDYPAANAKLQHAAYPDVRPLDLPMAPEDAFAAALALVKERGWEVLSDDPAESQIEAVATSRLYGFPDEVVIRVTAMEAGSRVDVRSRSRLGKIDRGANARRIRAFLSDLKSHISS